MEMADKIKYLRLEKGMTLEELGNKVDVGKSTVRKWENGIIANMKRDKIAKLANALETTPAYLMGWEDEIGNPTLTLGNIAQEGIKLSQNDEASAQSLAQLGLNIVEQTLLNACSDLNNEGQKKVIEYATLLRNSGEYKNNDTSKTKFINLCNRPMAAKVAQGGNGVSHKKISEETAAKIEKLFDKE